MEQPATADGDAAGDEPDVLATSADGTVRALGGYPGANAAAVRFDEGTLRLGQAFRDAGSEWTFYWNVGVAADAATDLTVALDDEVLGPWGPAVSHDRRSWRWLGADAAPDRETFHYDLAGGERVHFAMAPAYVRRDLERFLTTVADHPAVTRERLGTSPNGRAVPLVRLGDPDAAEHVVVACRHHACETPGSYALEGLVRGLLAADGALAGRCVHVAPMVDVDGVQRGDQGKSRVPHDHNRDYGAGNAILDDVARSTQRRRRCRSSSADSGASWRSRWTCTRPSSGATSTTRPSSPGRPRTRAGPPTGSRPCWARKRPRATACRSPRTPASPSRAGSAGTSFVAFCERAGATVALTLEVPYVGTAGDRATPDACRGLGRATGRAAVRWLDDQ